jgi:ankyrin repeat protein
MAKWLVGEGFDPLETYVTRPGEDGEEEAAELSLVFFAVARAQSNVLARYLMERGAKPGAFFAAAWWGNADILADMVRHGADINEVVGATPLHMAVDVVQRGIQGHPALGRRRLKCLREFLRLGADPNIAASDGTTPLHTALQKEYFDAFKTLVQHGANPDVPGKDGRTVREIAAKKRDKRYVQALI